MKTNLHWPMVILGLLLCTYGCRKASSNDGYIVDSNMQNKAPVASAGNDMDLRFPNESIELNGGNSFDPDGKITRWEWKQVEVISSVVIRDPLSPKTMVENLSDGPYKFELTVKDYHGLVGKDTVEIRTDPPGSLVRFHNLVWNDPVYCAINIENIDAIVPPSASFEVYIRSLTYGSSRWILVQPKALASAADGFYYEYMNGDLKIIDRFVDCNFDDSNYSVTLKL